MSASTHAEPNQAPKFAMVGGGALLVLALLLTWIIGPTTPPAEAVVVASETPEPAVTVTAEPSTEPVECKPEYQQIAVSHDNGKVDDTFQADFAKATFESQNMSDDMQQLLIEKTASSAQTLAIWSYGAGLIDKKDIENWESLAEGDCLNTEGQILHAQLEGALSAAGVKFEVVDAPANGTNTGVDADGTFGVASSSGITGDLKAIKVTFADGSYMYIMVRCGNLVLPGNPGLPEVPTDNPKKCPSGWAGEYPDCLQPKNWSKTPDNGWTPLGPGKETDGKVSQDQKDSGETRGNVIDDKVPAGTKSGDTTPDLNPGSVTAPGATPNTDASGKQVEDTSDDEVEEHAVQDDGGTNGATCVTDPFTGVNNCTP